VLKLLTRNDADDVEMGFQPESREREIGRTKEHSNPILPTTDCSLFLLAL
jgi:hypothetical protein